MAKRRRRRRTPSSRSGQVLPSGGTLTPSSCRSSFFAWQVGDECCQCHHIFTFTQKWLWSRSLSIAIAAPVTNNCNRDTAHIFHIYPATNASLLKRVAFHRKVTLGHGSLFYQRGSRTFWLLCVFRPPKNYNSCMWRIRGVFLLRPMSRAVDIWVSLSRRRCLKFHPNTDCINGTLSNHCDGKLMPHKF